MAGHPKVVEEALRRITAQLECSVCLDTLTDAKLLPCFHSFCKKCLERLVVQDRDGHTLCCPTCRRTTLLPPSGVSGLQTDFHTEHLFEIRETLAKMKEPQNTQCEKCKKFKATGFCRDCAKFVCEKCTEIHEMWEELATHQIVGTDVIEVEAANLVPPTKKVAYCPQHSGKKLKIYCETCGELICNDCTIRLHQGHNYDLVTDTFQKHRGEIVSSLQPVKQHLATVNEAIQALDARKKDIEDQRMTIETDIHKQINRLLQALEQLRTELVDQLDQLTQQKLKDLAAQRDQCKLVQTQLSSCLDYVEGSLKTSTEGEVLAMKTTVLKQVQQISAEFNPNILAPEQKANMVLVTNNVQELHRTCREFGKVVAQSVCPEKCYATGDGLKTATVGEEATVTLHTRDKDGRECEAQVPSLTAQLVHNKHATTFKCKVEWKDQYTYSIKYTPTTRGKHSLHIQVREKNVKGSPFTVTSLPSPQDLKNPIRMIENVQSPMGIVTNIQGHIVVAECTGHCVSVFTPNGKKIQSFGNVGSTKGQFANPRGIALDNEGNIYVVDTNNNRIQKFTSEGEPTTTVGVRGSGPLKFNTPIGITFYKTTRKLYVSDQHNHRVQILNTDLTLHGTFGSQGNGNRQFQRPIGSACDGAGNIYIADYMNHRIQVFTPDGKFLRKFGSQGSGPGQFNGPISVTIVGNRVYICDDMNHRICVFTTVFVYSPQKVSMSSHLVVKDISKVSSIPLLGFTALKMATYSSLTLQTIESKYFESCLSKVYVPHPLCLGKSNICSPNNSHLCYVLEAKCYLLVYSSTIKVFVRENNIHVCIPNYVH